ncbi:MFS family permease [Caulobacter ginsengisoli]|uniref:MFS family permease n=1 Tax=Caulobacter ginsengisoli TaxID=400775 RepID=A0ABU0IMB3_9CAUL|nr:MFS transporter [Caulobacter ginsengisoli]MDQ0462540.1 MFS family permease [Caulobacter ginsengisoli]
MSDSNWGELLKGAFFPRFALLCLGVWLNAADSLVTATIMPSVAAQLGGYAYFGWAVAIYTLGAIVAGASSGRLSAHLGLRTAMAVAGLTYSVGCLASALAPGIAVFLIGRLVQGIGAGWIVGLVYVAVGLVFPERLWARVFASTTSVWGVATVLGPLVGGVFAEAGHWRSAFWFFAVQGLAFSAAAAVLLSSKAPESAAEKGAGLALPQLSLLAMGVILIASAGLIDSPAGSVALVVAGLAMLAFMIRFDASQAVPLLPRDARRLTTAAGAGYAVIFCMAAGTTTLGVYGAAILQAVNGVGPLTAGYVVAAEALGWTLAALPIAGLAPRWHGLLIRVGGSMIPIGVAAMALTFGRPGLAGPIAAATLTGAGFGICWAFLARRVLASLDDTERPLGASAIPSTQQAGGATGAAAAGALGTALGLAHGIDAAQASAAAPWLFGAFLPVALLGGFAAWRLADCAPAEAVP